MFFFFFFERLLAQRKRLKMRRCNMTVSPLFSRHWDITLCTHPAVMLLKSSVTLITMTTLYTGWFYHLTTFGSAINLSIFFNQSFIPHRAVPSNISQPMFLNPIQNTFAIGNFIIRRFSYLFVLIRFFPSS